MSKLTRQSRQAGDCRQPIRCVRQSGENRPSAPPSRWRSPHADDCKIELVTDWWMSWVCRGNWRRRFRRPSPGGKLRAGGKIPVAGLSEARWQPANRPGYDIIVPRRGTPPPRASLVNGWMEACASADFSRWNILTAAADVKKSATSTLRTDVCCSDCEIQQKDARGTRKLLRRCRLCRRLQLQTPMIREIDKPHEEETDSANARHQRLGVQRRRCEPLWRLSSADKQSSAPGHMPHDKKVSRNEPSKCIWAGFRRDVTWRHAAKTADESTGKTRLGI